MKKCIWCQKDESEASFLEEAHSVPQNIGGENICENVCDNCNEYFGRTPNKNTPAIETVLKEVFNISRLLFLKSDNDIGKNKTLGKFSSIFFEIDPAKQNYKIKQAYKHQRFFQERMCGQLKRGIFKMFLEERERQFNDGLNPKYHFIREFARYGIGDYPVYYFTRLAGIIPMHKNWARHPALIFEKEESMKYLHSDSAFYEFEFLGHVFGIPITRSWELFFDMYMKESIKKKNKIFRSYKQIKRFDDIDYTLKIMA